VDRRSSIVVKIDRLHAPIVDPVFPRGKNTGTAVARERACLV
jgi:hypothetical protein